MKGLRWIQAYYLVLSAFGLLAQYTPAQVLVNGLLAGGFFLLGFYRAQSIIVDRFPWIGGGKRKGPENR